MFPTFKGFCHGSNWSTWYRAGLILAKGNPRGIHGLEDIARQDIPMSTASAVPEPGFAGLLPSSDAIEPEQITGYEFEEYTHMAWPQRLKQVRRRRMGIRAAVSLES